MRDNVDNNTKLDNVCNDILYYLYGLHKNCKSLEKLPVGIRKITKEMKPYNHKGQNVNHTLEYLVQAQYVKKVSKKMLTKNRIINDVHIQYKISDLGIYYYEKPDIFKPNDKYVSNINIERVESMAIIGNHNSIMVHQNHKEIASKIDKLLELMDEKFDKFTDSQMELISLVKMIEASLMVEKPNNGLISKMVDTLKDKAADSILDSAVKTIISSIIGLF